MTGDTKRDVEALAHTMEAGMADGAPAFMREKRESAMNASGRADAAGEMLKLCAAG